MVLLFFFDCSGGIIASMYQPRSFIAKRRFLPRLPIHHLRLFLLLVFCTLGTASEWQAISPQLIAGVEGYDDSRPGARGVAGVVVDRHTGAVSVGLNGPPYGIWTSNDAGDTWSRIDDGHIFGGWVRPASMYMDPDAPGRLVVFRVWPPGPEGDLLCQSGYTTDGGSTWSVFDNSKKFQRLAGWRHGMADFTQDPPALIAQSRIRAGIQVSRDGGESWDKCGMKGIVVDYCYTEDYLLATSTNVDRTTRMRFRGYGIIGDQVLIAKYDGVHRSSDGGENWTKVSEELVNGITPVACGGQLYWAAESGVLVSSDAGASWELLGTALPQVRQGPMFGANNDELVVVCNDGVYRSQDAGGSWNKISDLHLVEDSWRAKQLDLALHHDYAYDPTRQLLYVAGFAGSAYRKEVR